MFLQFTRCWCIVRTIAADCYFRCQQSSVEVVVFVAAGRITMHSVCFTDQIT